MPKSLTNWFIAVVAFFVLLLVVFGAHSQPLPSPANPARPVGAAVVPTAYDKSVAHDLTYSAKYLYLREKTGNNDAPEIDAWARANGVPLRSSWCGLFQWAINNDRKGPVPAGAAGSYNWFPTTGKNKARTFYIRDQFGSLESLAPADKTGFYYSNLGRIGHILMVVQATRGTRKGRPARGYILRSGNTGRGGGRDGAGVYDLFYTASDIYAASRW